MTALLSRTHRVVRITYIDATGEHDGGEARVHVSRCCDNCSSDGLKDHAWQEDGGVEEFGRCMNMRPAADDADRANQWCDDHQTSAEFEAGVHRPHVPVFAVVEGGAA